MIAANAIAPSFPPKPTNASCKRRIKIPNKNPDNAIQLIFMILAEVMPTKVDPINTYGILSERSSGKKSGNQKKTYATTSDKKADIRMGD
jgi:hypothetical protein